MSNITEVKFGKQAPEGSAQALRELADAMDRGEVTDFVAAYVRDDLYCFQLDASLLNGLALATLLQTKYVDKFRA